MYNASVQSSKNRSNKVYSAVTNYQLVKCTIECIQFILKIKMYCMQKKWLFKILNYKMF